MNKRQKIKKWFKDHFTKKNIINWLFVGLIALIVILCVYFENKDKETMKNKKSNISIVNDNIDLKKNALYDSIFATTYSKSLNSSNIDDYINYSDFNYNGQGLDQNATLKILRLDLQSVKSNLLTYNNNSYSIDINSVSIMLSYLLDFYFDSSEYFNVYYLYTNNTTYSFEAVNQATLKIHWLISTTCNASVIMPLNFDYNFLDIYYYDLNDTMGNEFYSQYQTYSLYNNEMSYINQQLQNQNNELQERVNNLELQLDESLLAQDIKYNLGYQVGLNEGANQDLATNGFTALLNSIFSYPINFISTVFNFEFMGINVASILLFLVSIGVVLFVVKRLWK